MHTVLPVHNISSAQPTAGEGYEMDAIASTAIGGTSMSGGIGSLSGTILGFVIIGLLMFICGLMGETMMKIYYETRDTVP